MDIKIATGGKPNKSTGFFFLHLGTLGVHNTMDATIDWTSCQIISLLIMGCGLVSIDRYAWYCVCQDCQICSKCNNFPCTFVWFSTRSDLNIHSISTCNVSNERKLILYQIYNSSFLSRGYTPGVMIELFY